MQIKFLMNELDRLYPDAACSLSFNNPIELLVSTQLSAQCTDARVNTVTPALFSRYKSVYELASADIGELQSIIHPLGFFRSKSKNIINCCKMIADDYGGELPDNLEDMLKLPGVGRKTANLVLWEVFKIPGVVVDTHAARIAKRLGITASSNPVLIEKDIMKVIPEEKWSIFSHQLVLHGRALCMARNPGCAICPIACECSYATDRQQ